jgi:Secretion system C-terminal sorting domain
MHFSEDKGATFTTFNYAARLYVRQGSVANTYQLGILNNGTGTPTSNDIYGVSPQNLSINTTYLIVIKHTFTGNSASLYINPTPGAIEPAATFTSTFSATAAIEAESICIRTSNSSGIGTGDIQLDELRWGTTWASVTPASAATPTITATPLTLSGFTTNQGTASATQNYDISGSNLTADITVTPPTGFEIKKSTDVTYASSLTLTQTSGTVASTTINVRLTGASVGTPSGDITNVSSGATTVNVAVSGTVNAAATPTLTVTPATLSSFTTITGTASAQQSYTLSGTDLTGFPSNVVVTAPTNYEVSLTSGSGFASFVNVAYTSATLATTTIYVRIAAAAGVGSPSGNVINVGGGATSKNVAVSGTVNAVPVPTITANPTTLSGFNTPVGTPSSTQNYTISGVNLAADIAITAPTGFEIKKSTDVVYASSLTLTQTSGTVASTTINVRLTGTTISTPSGNITNVSGSANNPSIAVSGTVTAALTVTPISSIRNAIDANGSHIAPYTVGTPVIITGQIYGVNTNIDATTANGTKQKFQFGIIDNSTGRNGTVIRSTGTADIAPIDLQEGDIVTVTGKVGFFSGLTQIDNVTSVTRTSVGNARKTPIDATALTEDNESQLVKISNISIPTAAQWTGSASNVASFNVDIVLNSVTYVMRIDKSTELAKKTYSEVFSTATSNISIVGLGGQNKSTGSPFTSGYQFLPYKISDIALPSTLSVSPTSLVGFSTVTGTASAVQTYNVSGSLLNTNLTITAPTGFEVSDGGAYSNSIVVTPTSGNINSTISVRIASSATSGVYSGNITNTSSGITQNVSLSGIATNVSGETPVKIADLDPITGTGLPLLNGVVISTSGTVYGINTNTSSSFPTRLQFALIANSPRAGVQVRYDLSSPSLNYTVAEGDVVTVVGTVGNYQGMTTITPTAITKNSAGATLVSPLKVSGFINETHESDLITLDSVKVTSGWGVTEPGKDYWRVTVTNNKGVDYSMRVDNDTDIIGKTQPAGKFTLIGLGMQDDITSPFLENYQIAPRRFADIQEIPLTATENEISRKVSVYPNPANDVVRIQGLPEGYQTELVNMFGEVILKTNADKNDASFQVENFAKGIYLVRFSKGNQQFSKRLVIQ